MELLNNNNCCLPPWEPGPWLETCCCFYSIMLSHQRWRGPTKWLMAFLFFYIESQLFVFISAAGRIEGTCFRHVSLKVLKENKSLGNHFKRPYWRMKWNAGLFELWNKVCSFPADCLSINHSSDCTALNPRHARAQEWILWKYFQFYYLTVRVSEG